MTELIVKQASIDKDGRSLVKAISFHLCEGELVILLGPNGAGKSLTLRAVQGLEPLSGGTAKLDGIKTHLMAPAERALKISYLPQTRQLAWPNIVRDIVSLGRYAHGAPMGHLRSLDAKAVHDAIEACDISHLAERKATTLSGGELARVHCARAFAAQTPLLIADEPINALDPRHQFRVMDLIKRYVANGGGALVVLHDIAMAARYASRLIWMQEGKIIADGPPSDTLSEERIRAVYGIATTLDGLNVRIDGAL